jgi:hypothetical protein
MKWGRKMLLLTQDPEPDLRTERVVAQLHDEIDRLRGVTHELQEVLAQAVNNAHTQALRQDQDPANPDRHPTLEP